MIFTETYSIATTSSLALLEVVSASIYGIFLSKLSASQLNVIHEFGCSFSAYDRMCLPRCELRELVSQLGCLTVDFLWQIALYSRIVMFDGYVSIVVKD